jgi:hypothetical protein
MPLDIFLSVGRTANAKQEDFVLAVEALLRENGFNPRTVGRTDFTTEKPLKTILEVMRSCQGSVIVSFERLHIEKGLELAGGDKEARLKDVSLPTVWNQIEAAMAYTLGLPLLAIAEERLRDEGFLEKGYDWFVEWMELEVASLHERNFVEAFKAWKKRVETAA